MKKNRMMRMASGLLVLTLLTSCIISGTFAKYVTSAAGGDSAKVAYWGVQIEEEGNLFGKTYYSEEEGNTTQSSAEKTSITVQTTGTDNVIAPGTKGSMTIKITGKPEVRTKVGITFNEKDCSEITLPKGVYTHKEGVSGVMGTKVTLGEAYKPVKFYFCKASEGLSDVGDNDYYTFDTLKEKISAAFNATYEPNSTNLAQEYILAWCWPFKYLPGDESEQNFEDDDLRYVDSFDNQEIKVKKDSETAGSNNEKEDEEDDNDGKEETVELESNADIIDFCDTYLGNVAAKTIVDNREGLITEEKLSFTISVTQVD